MGVLPTSHSDIYQCLVSDRSCGLCGFSVFVYVRILLANLDTGPAKEAASEY